MMRKIFFQNLVMGLLLAGLLVSVTPARAFGASIKDEFTIAWKQFHALTKNSEKSKYRSEWDNVAKKFRNVFKRSPRGEYAPKSLYYLGRSYEELGYHSGLESDLRKAVDYYGRMVANFPSHAWTDDSLFRRAEIRLRKLNEKDLAYSDYLTIVHRYSKSDMYSRARSRLDSMDRNGLSKKQQDNAEQAKPSGTIVPASAPAVEESSSKRAKLMAVRYTSSDSYTRVVLDLDGEVRFRYQLLNPNQSVNRPHRLYIDLENTILGNDVNKATDVADGILKDIRSAQRDPRTTRVVLDFNSMQDYKIFPLENPFRLVVDVQAPEEGAAEQPKTSTPAAKQKRTAKTSTKYTPPANSKAMAGDLLEQLGLTFKTIMIDPGHGGKDPGASGHGLREKDINLRFTKILAAKLKKAGFNILYTRSTDVFIPLEERTAMANIKKADMFISIHCNAHRNSDINGLETYTLNLARNRNAVRVAARENAISAKRISDLQVILTDLMLNSKMKESKDLAKNIHKKALANVRLKFPIKDQGVREAPFYVLMGAKMPSVLVELGYVTNKTESSRLKSEKYLGYIADGIVKGILEYKKQIERYASI
ncbi:N-acetylmuramoyl-L-alanine amidase [Desulfovibrio gilichinskyi]|uniref:N-acetylmuramoyl-L-alanine amidase n=1 Tax=Desulfovibrio gilichinskyi TaxID=1519643 RepID=A0A1X7EIL6_9BACT|nr:N-acetylmuramoyl-L-alanine amidase [Desulfovibrio gilichinskyi]SMF34428.1 N-acetylmuramoyl-L-alanine amidase [Desulfovibrio gilichinskyi]